MAPVNALKVGSLGGVTAFLLCSGCAFDRIEVSRPSLSLRDAQKAVLASTLSSTSAGWNGAALRVNRHRMVRESGSRDGYAFTRMMDIRVEIQGNEFCVRWGEAQESGWVYFKTRQDAVRLAEALLVLKDASGTPVTEEADFAAFLALAKGPRPEMPDATRADKALAEDAFRRKDFMTALYAYGDALDKYPLWPEGQYNAALLAAEVEDFELAAHHMRRYLVLAPDAKDAAASKGKLLLWERKTKS